MDLNPLDNLLRAILGPDVVAAWPLGALLGVLVLVGRGLDWWARRRRRPRR